jgi:hypothetical protein
MYSLLSALLFATTEVVRICSVVSALLGFVCPYNCHIPSAQNNKNQKHDGNNTQYYFFRFIKHEKYLRSGLKNIIGFTVLS